jgi:hypothetical protein
MTDMTRQSSSVPTRKVSVQAAVTIIVWLAMRYGLEIPADVGLALGILLEALVPVVAGFGVAYWTPPAQRDGIVS